MNKLNRIILRNAHIIADNTHEYLNGAIGIEDEIITDVYPHDNKIKNDLSEYEEIDLAGAIVMPAYFDVRTGHNIEAEVANYIASSEYEYQRDESCLGINLYEPLDLKKREGVKAISLQLENYDERDIRDLRAKGIRVFLSKGGYQGEEYDAYYDLFDDRHTPFNVKGTSPINKAFYDKRYKELCLDDVDDGVIRLILNNMDREKIMLCSKNKAIMAKSARSLYALGYHYTDILAMTSLNAYRFYGLSKLHGTIAKGKMAELLIMDDDLNLIRAYRKGRFIND